MLALAAGAHASGDSFGFPASLGGAANGHATFRATLTGTSLAWQLTFTGPATSAELAGTKLGVSLCRPCSSRARGKVVLTAAQAMLLEHGKATARLHTKSGVLAGKGALLAVTGQTGPGGATEPAPGSGPAGSTWSATAVALRGQSGNRFEFVCPPNASAAAGPVWGG